MLESLTKHGADWNQERWREDWRHWAEHTSAYLDGATRQTLENLRKGDSTPSGSHDLAGASRMAPLFAVFSGDALIQAARNQTEVTHGSTQVLDAAEFFVRATEAVRGGSGFRDAFEAASGQVPVEHGEPALSCPVDGAFPQTLNLALQYETNPVAGLMGNAMLGGDSAARGMLLGLLLGARHGADVFPGDWLANLEARDRILSALS